MSTTHELRWFFILTQSQVALLRRYDWSLGLDFLLLAHT